MTETNDYEKAEKQSFKKYETSDLRKVFNEPNEWLAHKAGFRDGYQLGKAHAEMGTDCPQEHNQKEDTAQIARCVRKGMFDGNYVISQGNIHIIPSLRFQAATAAMQGLLSAPTDFYVQSKEVNHIAADAVKYADALLNELNKENNATDSH